MTDAADTLRAQLVLAGIDGFIPEYRFAAEHVGPGKGLRDRLAQAGMQDWRFDLAWPAALLAVEVDGGGWVNGRHSRGAGMESDCAKFSLAVALGWRVMRVTPRQVKDGRALRWVERALGVSEAGSRWALDHCS